MTAWVGKPCAQCGGKKGRAYARQKYCGNCKRKAEGTRREKQWAAAIFRVYGITAEDYYKLLAYQDGACYLCQRAKGTTKKLAVDHDHATGEVRGLLCGTCNKIVGHARDDAAFFLRGAHYLGTPPWMALQMSKEAA